MEYGFSLLLWHHLFPLAIVVDPKAGDSVDVAGLAEGEARPLSFYVENVPNAVSIDSKGKLVPLQWKKIDSGTPYPSIEKLDQNLFPGGLCVVSYLRRNSLEMGVIRKNGILLLAPTREWLFRVVYFAEQGTSSLVETYTVETTRLLNEESFLSVTCHYSGNGGLLARQYFRWKNSTLVRHEVWSGDTAIYEEIVAAGWERQTRGHWKNTKAGHEFLAMYRKHENANGGRVGFATIRIDYEWVNEQLTPKKWSVRPEGEDLGR
ncbi:MAG: hypothetical protein QNK83_13675 [Akkermansiaceae bacterium]